MYIPKAGDTVTMDSRNARLYRNMVEWEQGKNLRYEGENVYLGDSLITAYHFLKNYYFVAGDKAENSRDSRYWGLLPEEYIVGKAVRVWKSTDPMTKEIRWERTFRRIDN